jgi:hypothetical protein
MFRKINEALEGLKQLADDWGSPALFQAIRRAMPRRRGQGSVQSPLAELPVLDKDSPFDLRSLLEAGKGPRLYGGTDSDRPQSRFQQALERLTSTLERLAKVAPGLFQDTRESVEQRYDRLKKGGNLLPPEEVASRYPREAKLTREMMVRESERDLAQRMAIPAPVILPTKTDYDVPQGEHMLLTNLLRSSRLGGKIGQSMGLGAAKMFGAEEGGAAAIKAANYAGGLGALAGAVAGTTAMVIGANVALAKFAESVAEAGRELADFHPGYGMSLAQYDFAQMQMGYQTARDTAGTYQPMVEAVINMQREVRPIKVAIDNAINILARDAANTVAQFADWTKSLMRLVGLGESLMSKLGVKETYEAGSRPMENLARAFSERYGTSIGTHHAPREE